MPAQQTTATVRRRYAWLASIYDWANLEGMLYADARTRAIEMLELRPGARVLDVACGTGANFALIEQRIGPSGELVGIDLTPQMLARARIRVLRNGCLGRYGRCSRW
jgi:ubiquinone/menaquinone biosynthesis C-methylase UbiE